MKKALTLLWAPVIAAALFACASQTQVQSPYDDTVARADVLLEIPALRQYGGYTCGTTCVQMPMCMQAWSSAVGGAEVSDFGRRTRFVTCAQKHEKAFMHYDN